MIATGLVIALELATACAPNVAPSTIQSIIQVESSGNPLAINVNGGKLHREPSDAADAAELAREYIDKGYSVDMGLMQVNSRNLSWLGFSVEEMFEPCTNITAGAQVLANFYSDARGKYADEQSALRAALSAYNTGSFSRGFNNGYVSRYFAGGAANPTVAGRAANPNMADTVVFVRNRHQQEDAPMKRAEKTMPIVSTNPDDSDTPGVQIEQTADDAERNGAFEETAMSEADAWEANADLAVADPHATAIVMGGQAITAADEKAGSPTED